MSNTLDLVRAAVTEALKASDSDGFIGPYAGGTRVTLDGHFDLEAVARAAIAAMRNPTDETMWARMTGKHYPDAELQRQFTAMIDHILGS